MLGRSLLARTAALIVGMLALVVSSSAQGDLHIGSFQVSPLTSQTQASVDAGLAALATYDPVSAGELEAAVNNGTLDIGELVDPAFEGFLGCTDGNTLGVRLNDGVDDAELAARLRHEWEHWKYGHPDPPWFNGGSLSDCDHYQDFVDTYDQLSYMSCNGYTVSCQELNTCIAFTDALYLACIAEGGSPTWPTNSPDNCCQ